MKLFSDEYQKLLEKAHEESWGNSGKSWVDYVEKFAKEIHAESILDYGAGKGTLETVLRERGWVNVQSYDPGVEKFSKAPSPADLVVCCDVLEHIEPECLSDVLTHISSLANKGVFFNIATSPSKKTLTDGRNAHLIVKNGSWWGKRITKVFPGCSIRKDKLKGVVFWVKRL